MVSKDVVAYLGGWGMSIASQRAKERENRTPDVEVMVKMVKLGKLKLAWAVVPLGADEDMTTLDTTKNIAYMHICPVISSANYSIIYLYYPEQNNTSHTLCFV